jgi:hypothetical protein
MWGGSLNAASPNNASQDAVALHVLMVGDGLKSSRPIGWIKPILTIPLSKNFGCKGSVHDEQHHATQTLLTAPVKGDQIPVHNADVSKAVTFSPIPKRGTWTAHNPANGINFVLKIITGR